MDQTPDLGAPGIDGAAHGVTDGASHGAPGGATDGAGAADGASRSSWAGSRWDGDGDGTSEAEIAALRVPGARGKDRIPEATVARLPVYLRCLIEVADAKTTTISSERLAEMAGANAAKVRKDLSHLGSYGTRGVGYDVEYLLFQISRILGLTRDWPVVIVGVGNLGHALANYRGFSARGYRIAALVDCDRAKVGERLGDLEVRHLDELTDIAAAEEIAIGIIATPAAVAQDVADRLVAAGVTSILNFAPAVITVPRGVSLRKVDLSIELQILSFYQQRRAGLPRDGDRLPPMPFPA